MSIQDVTPDGVSVLERIPLTQKVGIYYKAGDVRVVERHTPRIGPDEALVKVSACTLCAGEAMDWYSTKPGGKVLGHEPVGTIVAVGHDADKSWLGRRVFVHHHYGRLNSHDAHRGHYTIDPFFHETRLDPGGMAQYFRITAGHLLNDTHIIPDSIGDDVATTIEPWACVLGGLKVSHIQPGDTVVVIGAGAMGLGFVHLARFFGAGRVIADDLNPWRLVKARELGATHVVNPNDGDVAEQILAANDGEQADVVVVTVPSAQAYGIARRLVRQGGTIHLNAPGRPGTDWTQDAAETYFSEVTITSKYSADHNDTYQYLRLLKAGVIDPSPIITHHYPLSRLPEAFDLLVQADQSLKIVINPD